MARFVINQPIDTREPTIAVDEGLPIGRHRFQLIVFDSSGNKSRPDIATVEISERPTPTGPGGPVLTIGPVGPVVGPVVTVGPVGPVVGPVIDPVGPVVGPVGPSPVGPVIREPVEPIRVAPQRRRRKPTTPRRHRDKKEK